jgi:preprotein translocase subunit SecG
MTAVLLVVHLFVTLALIGVVLIQRSEGGGLGIGSSQGMGAFMSGRGTANLLTRATAILATIFMLLSLTLALLNRGTQGVAGRSILDTLPSGPVQTAPAGPLPVGGAPAGSPPAGAPSGPAPATEAPSGAAPAGTAPSGTTQGAPPAAPAAPKGPVVPTN